MKRKGKGRILKLHLVSVQSKANRDVVALEQQLRSLFAREIAQRVAQEWNLKGA
jgi:hypothetical protein